MFKFISNSTLQRSICRKHKLTAIAFVKRNKREFSTQANGEFNGKEEEKKIILGGKEVDSKQKLEYVDNIFTNCAENYDLINDVMSFGLQRLWKRKVSRILGSLEPHKIWDANSNQYHYKPLKIIDVCGGTAEIAFKILERSKGTEYYKTTKLFPVELTVFDLNKEMIRVGKQRASKRKLPAESKSGSKKQRIGLGLKFIEGNAEELPFESNSFEHYTVGFGIRNVTDRKKALSECLRVLKPNGKMVCLDMSHFSLPILKPFYNFHVDHIVPRIGNLLNKNFNLPYTYLIESARLFYTQTEFVQALQEVGFRNCGFINVGFGACAIHYATK